MALLLDKRATLTFKPGFTVTRCMRLQLKGRGDCRAATREGSTSKNEDVEAAVFPSLFPTLTFGSRYINSLITAAEPTLAASCRAVFLILFFVLISALRDIN